MAYRPGDNYEAEEQSLSHRLSLILIPCQPRCLIMEYEYTSCRVTCHRCAHRWTYMGNRLLSLQRSRRPVRVGCPRCHAKVIMNAQEAV